VPDLATVIPSARRLINSLRDLGYETREAVADLIDNSIAAGAHAVDVDIAFDGTASSIRIADDGRGMSAAEITEAMRYGAAREYEDDDLGKFGLGLKTASMSQCRRLSIASRTSRSTARIEARQLDLAYVERHDDWSVLILRSDERPDRLTEPLRAHRGTVVLWEDLDRVLSYKDPHGGWAERRMKDLAADLDLHLGMVFHRFLAGEVPRRKLRIRINGTRIDPWDPFARDEDETVALGVEDVPLSTADGAGIVRMESFILPPKAAFSSLTAWRRASGPSSWNSQQGFYIYRAERLIQSGGWCGVRTTDEHMKLSRIALRFGPELDHAFDVNVAKMRVKLPPALRTVIRDEVMDAARRARVVYDARPDGGPPRLGGRRSAPPPGGPAAPEPAPGDLAGQGQGPGPSPGPGPGSAPGPGSSPEPSPAPGPATPGGSAFVAPRRALEQAAVAAGESVALRRIVGALHEQAPEVARSLGW
jgi:Histidine kinase-, DNA gyrase B-, and HSP90-like ATPase